MTRGLHTPLRASRVLEHLGASRFADDLRHLGVVDSTSNVLLDMAHRGRGQDGTVIVAEGQSAGRGSHGRSWHSPTGLGIWASVLLQPPPADDTARRLLSATASLAIARAVDEFGVDSRLKWPNDVLVSSHKIAGCIVDLSRDFAIVGLGINANLGPGDLPRGSEVPAASLRTLLGHRVDRERLLAATLRHLDELLRDIEERGAERTLDAVVARDGLRGARVTAQEGERQVRGVVERSHPLEGIDVRIDPATVIRLRPEHSRLLSCRLA